LAIGWYSQYLEAKGMRGMGDVDLNRDRGMKIVIDLGKLPSDPGNRADIYHAIQILRDNGMIEWLEWDGEKATSSG
jgi:hypothetical protein